jgi:hypothetical protein
MLLVYKAEGCTEDLKQPNFEGDYAASPDAFTFGSHVL